MLVRLSLRKTSRDLNRPRQPPEVSVHCTTLLSVGRFHVVVGVGHNGIGTYLCDDISVAPDVLQRTNGERK